MTKVLKTMCIGCACEAFIFTEIFNTRINGPVDNMHGYDFKSTLDLFNGKLFDAILNDKIDKLEDKGWKEFYEDDSFLRYYCKGDIGWNWRTEHTNFEQNDRKLLLKERINAFNNFLKEAQNNDNYNFIYGLSDGDQYLNEETFNYVINNLPEYVINNLIIVGSIRYKIPKLFFNRFRCIEYNIDLTNRNELPLVKWW